MNTKIEVVQEGSCRKMTMEMEIPDTDIGYAYFKTVLYALLGDEGVSDLSFMRNPSRCYDAVPPGFKHV